MTYLLAWQNLIFLIPILIGLVAALATATGLGAEAGDTDATVETSVEADAGEHDVDDLADHAFDHGSDSHGVQSVFNQALSLLGVGKVPLSIVITLLNLSFGLVGLVLMNTIFSLFGKLPIVSVLLSSATAAVVAIAITSFLAKAMSKVVPSFETRTVSKKDLLFRSARLVLPADGMSGYAQVIDEYGSMHQVRCRSRGEAIAAGIDAMLVDYDAKEDFYTIEETTLERLLEHGSLRGVMRTIPIQTKGGGNQDVTEHTRRQATTE